MKALTEAQILALQAHAIATNSSALRSDCWTALGYCARVAFEPVTAREQREAEARCLVALEMMALMHVAI